MAANQELLLSKAEQLRLTHTLHQEGLFGIKENPADFITLKSKRKSPHYLDIRPGISSYQTRQFVASNMLQVAERQGARRGFPTIQEAYDYLAGTPEAFTSYATSLADLAKMGVLQPRVDVEKARGNKTPILGRYQAGARIAEFDDVVTDGESKIDTIKMLGAAGLVVADYFVVVDREEGGADQVYRETKMNIIPALTASSMAIMLYAENEINRTQFDNVAAYLEQYGGPLAKANMGIVF